MIQSDSRYYLGDRAIYTAADGRQIAYMKRRILPAPDAAGAVASTVTIPPGARLDLITAKTLGNPLLFWRIADLNQAMDPSALTDRPGKQLLIPALGN